MATFNWSPNSQFTTNAYVHYLGVDNNDGTANKPYRTIQKAVDAGKYNIQYQGVCRERIINTVKIFGDGYSVYDGRGVSYSLSELPLIRASLYNFKVIGIQKNLSALILPITKTERINCFFEGLNFSRTSSGDAIAGLMCVFKNCTLKTNPSIIDVEKCTFVSSDIRFYPSNLTASCRYNVFFNSKIWLPTSALTDATAFLSYSVFFNCQYAFGSETYKTISQIEIETGKIGIDALRQAHYNIFGGNLSIFEMSKVIDPLFNNADVDDYTLHPLSPARHMAYDGTYIGAKDVGFPTYAYANDLGYPNAFYNASKHANVIVANNSITLARNPDGSAVGSGFITEKPKKLGQIYELKGNGSSYMGADRNREMLDVNSDIGDLASPISAGTPLTSGVIYINEGGSVVYNGTTHANRSRITAVDSVQSFTTTEGAVLHAVTEYPNRYTNLIRHKQTIPGTQIAAGTDVLTADSWYRVLTNPITWDGKTIPVDDCFQAVAGKLSFTGTGVCVAEFSAADVWSECIIDAPIKCRRIGNVASGAIDTGTDGKPLTNGHKEYYNATNKVRAEFSIFAAYVQKHWVLNAKMSK